MADRPMGFGKIKYSMSGQIYGGAFGFDVPSFTAEKEFEVYGQPMGFGENENPKRYGEFMNGKPFEGTQAAPSSIYGNDSQNTEIIDGMAKLIIELVTGIVKVFGAVKKEYETYSLTRTEDPHRITEIPQIICSEEQPVRETSPIVRIEFTETHKRQSSGMQKSMKLPFRRDPAFLKEAREVVD